METICYPQSPGSRVPERWRDCSGLDRRFTTPRPRRETQPMQLLTRTQTHTHTHTNKYARTHAGTHARTHARTHTHTRTHRYTHWTSSQRQHSESLTSTVVLAPPGSFAPPGSCALNSPAQPRVLPISGFYATTGSCATLGSSSPQGPAHPRVLRTQGSCAPPWSCAWSGCMQVSVLRTSASSIRPASAPLVVLRPSGSNEHFSVLGKC